MRGIWQRLGELVREESGASAVEYAMIIGLIALATFLVYKYVGIRVFVIMNKLNIRLRLATKVYTPS